MHEYVPLDSRECQRLIADVAGASFDEKRLIHCYERTPPDTSGGEIGGRGDNHIVALMD